MKSCEVLRGMKNAKAKMLLSCNVSAFFSKVMNFLDACGATRYNLNVLAIKSIMHRGLKRLYEEDSTRGIDSRFAGKLRDMLLAIDNATDVSETEARPPGWRLHQLSGDLNGFWSLTVSGNRRLIFRFEDGDAFEFDLLDYHQEDAIWQNQKSQTLAAKPYRSKGP